MNLQDILPTKKSQWTAASFLVLSAWPFFLPKSWLGEIRLQQDTLQWLLQLGLSATWLLVGSLVVLIQVVVTEQKNIQRRADLAAWRKMVTEIASINDDEKPVVFYLERHEFFPSLKPHLTKTTLGMIYRNNTMIVGSTIEASLSAIQNDIAALEKQWGLP